MESPELASQTVLRGINALSRGEVAMEESMNGYLYCPIEDEVI